MTRNRERFRLDSNELHKIVFALFKTLNIMCLRKMDAWERTSYTKKIINGTHHNSKLFPFYEQKRHDTPSGSINSFVISETNKDEDEPETSRWVKPIFSTENNCANLHQIMEFEPMESSQTPYQDIGQLPSEKSDFSMVHFLYASRMNNLRGSCRTCSRDINRNSTDSYGLLIMDSNFHLLPDCSMKLSLPHNSGFILRLGVYLEGNRLYEIEDIEVPSVHFLNVFTNIYEELFSSKNLERVRKFCSVANQTITRCVLQAIVKKSPKNKYKTGALEEVLKQGYYPLFDFKSDEITIDIEQAKLTQKIAELAQIVSRSSDPYIYTDEIDILSRDRTIFDKQSDLSDPSVSEWPLLYLGLTDNLRIQIQDELKYGRDYSFLQETIIKGLKSEETDNLIELGIDTMRFWM